MKALRKRLTYANVMSSLALFLVLAGGTAFAASQLGKETVGAKQLKKGAVTPAKLSSASKKTLTGATGPQGPKGDRGEKGERGERGERGEPGPAVVVLPAGQTETGVWGAGAENENWAIATIRFDPTLPEVPASTHQKFLAPGETTSDCPGSRRAAPGFLCVYAAWNYHLVFDAFFDGFDLETGVDKTGTVIYLKANAKEANARGSWAYTAP